jgi:colicin import membrane protein
MERRNTEDLKRVEERKDLEHEREMLRLHTDLQNQLTEASTRAAAEFRDLYEASHTSWIQERYSAEFLYSI